MANVKPIPSIRFLPQTKVCYVWLNWNCEAIHLQGFVGHLVGWMVSHIFTGHKVHGSGSQFQSIDYIMLTAVVVRLLLLTQMWTEGELAVIRSFLWKLSHVGSREGGGGVEGGGRRGDIVHYMDGTAISICIQALASY